MIITGDPAEAASIAPRAVFAAGFFDGIHLGHRRILERTVQAARATGAQAWALTFEPHPMRILDPRHAPPLLTGLELRLERLAGTGVDGCLLIPFTAEFSELSPAQFCSEVFGHWDGVGCACTVVSGRNWHFGRGRAGTLSDVSGLSGGRISTELVDMVYLGGERVSSSRVRRAVLEGRVNLAAEMLGRPHSIRERTVSGRGVGRSIGFATANIVPHAEVMPPAGVYEVCVSIAPCGEKAPVKALANYGYRPTFPDSRPDKPVLEVHIPGLCEDLHGKVLDVGFVRRLRGEKAFSSPEELSAQILKDIEEVFGKHGVQSATMA